MTHDPPARLRGLAIPALAAALLASGPAAAQGPTATEEIIDLRPEPGQEAELLAALRLSLDHPVSLIPLPDSVLSELAWRDVDPLRAQCEAQAKAVAATLKLDAPPTGTSASFAQLVDLAAQRNLFLDIGGAEAALEEARYWVSCLDEPLAPSALAAFLVQEALAWQYRQGKVEPRLFDDVVAVDARAYEDQRLSPPVRRALQEAADRRARAGAVPLAVDLPGVWMDGAQAVGVVSLYPGRHVLQVEGPGGQWRSRWAAVAQEGAPERLSDLTTFGLPLPSDLRRELSRDLLAGDLAPEREAALTTWMGSVQRERQGFVLLAADTFALRVLTAGGEVSAVALPEVGPRRATVEDDGRVRVSGRVGPQFSGVGALGETLIPWSGRLGYGLEGDLDRGRLRVAARVGLDPHVRSSAGGECRAPAPNGEPTEEDLEDYFICLDPRLMVSAGVGAGLVLRPGLQWEVAALGLAEASWLPQLVTTSETAESSGYLLSSAVLVGPAVSLSGARRIALPGAVLDLGVSARVGYATAEVEGVRASVIPWSAGLVLGVEP